MKRPGSSPPPSLGPRIRLSSSGSNSRPGFALGLGGVTHDSGRVPGGWERRPGLGSPTGKTRFSPSGRRPGGNRLVVPPQALPVPAPSPPPPQRSPAGFGKRRPAAVASQGHPLPRRPRPRPRPPGHTWAPPRVPGPDSAEPQRGRGERGRPRRGGPDPNRGPVAKKPDPRLGLRQQSGAAASPATPTPSPLWSRKASGAAALRRPQAETRTLDGGSVGESPAGKLDRRSPTPPRLPAPGWGRRSGGGP